MEEEEDECPGAELWLMSFADLMTLLFAAFVVLYGITPQGKSDEVLGVASSIREAFIEIPDDIPVDIKRKGPIIQGKAVFKYFRGEQTRPPIIKRYKRSTKVINVINADIHEAESVLVLKSSKGMDKATTSKASKDISVHKDADGFRLRLVASQFYGPGEYRIDRKKMKRVEMVANFLNDLGRNITIEGHTDNSPPSGEMSNLQLSSLRASYMAQYFIKVLEFPKELISVAGFGDLKPTAPNDTKAGKMANRRIEIKIHYDDK